MDQDMERTSSLIEKAIERLGVDSVFGEPIRDGDTTIIPVASVTYGFGMGSGYEAKGEAEGEEAETPRDHAGGKGGGGGGKAKPVGYIRLGPGEPEFVSTFDPNRIALAGIFLSAWSIFWITKTIRAFVKRG